MKKPTSPETQTPGRHLITIPTRDQTEDTVDHSLLRRARLRDRHAQNVARLMEQRRDLRGVYPLADFVDEAIRWTA
ncbi:MULTISPECIES: hypothetical protein [Nocardioides]|uniref:Uncharacterized protein n=1 Tax=Nocardioides vastitatis TaxID=2568655 RepID=A0ABW0ZEQ9_9ACTN|nr:hypothetical protein [Nocardioides sp.]THI95850.1 hypothetical protein E7Z54_18105 [Nocardioides sp.]